MPGPKCDLARHALRDAAVFLGFLLLTLTMTWPWATHLRGACSDPGDPYLVSYILWWDFHGTFTQPLHLFDASIFFPYKDTLAFSEHCWGIALPFFPLLALGVAPLTVHGVATLLGIAASAFGAFRLGRTLTGSTGAGWISGIAFGFALYRFGQLPHLPYLFTPWMPLLFEALVLFATRPSWRRASWLGFAFLMNGLTAVHWLILTAIPLGLTGVWLIARKEREAIRLILQRGGAALGAAGVLLLPFLIPYVRVSRRLGLIRPPAEAAYYSAVPADWLVPDTHSRVWTRLVKAPFHEERALFPGAVVLLLTATSGLALRSHRHRDALAVGSTWTLLGFLGSLGMNFVFHRLLFDYVPLFRSIRVPARWAMVANLGLALLAALGALLIAEKLDRWRRGASTIAYAVLCSALVFDLRAAPLNLYGGAPEPDPVTRKLAVTPMKGGLVELPAGRAHGGLDVPDFVYVLRAADHGKPLVNATSGFGTREASRIRSLSQKRTVPDELLDLFESIPVSYVTVREAWLLPDERESLHEFLARGIASGRLRFEGRFDPRIRADLYAVVKTEPDSPPGPPLPWTPPATPLASRAAPGPVDLSLTGGLDGMESDFSVRGQLRVSGWARLPGEDLGVTVLIDGEERPPLSFRRVRRDDVTRAIPRMGDCSTAGFEALYAPRPDDAGRHELLVLFRAKDSRYRPYPMRRFTWNP